jgi:hypothetical protein
MAVPRHAEAELLPPVAATSVPAERRVEIRIGSVDVRAEQPSPPPTIAAAARRSPSAARGFDDYRAIRSHSAWDI